MALSRAEQIAVDLVWQIFSTSGKWPDRHRLVLALDDEGLTLEDASGVLAGISIRPSYEAPSPERARLNIRGWGSVDAARVLLQPIGQVVARLARSFIQNPVAPNAGGTGTPWSSFRSLWQSEEDWQQMSTIVRWGLEFPLNATPTESDCFFTPSLDLLRFERVQSLEDVLEVLATPRGRLRVGLHPAGTHRAFLLKVFEHVQRHHEWPNALDFAVQQRSLGFVPDIQRDLRAERFVRGDYSARNRIELRPESVAVVDDSGEGRKLLLSVLAKCRDQWRHAPGAAATSTDLAAALGVNENSLKQWLLFLDFADWTGESTLAGAVWSLRPNELILRYRHVQHWDDYLAIRELVRTEGAWANESTQPEAQRLPPDLASSRAKLRRLLKDGQITAVVLSRLDEFERVFAVEAWQAAMLLLGSAMEGVLLDVLGRNLGKAESLIKNSKKGLGDVGLGELMQIAEALKLIDSQVRAIAWGLKDFRDLIHPNRAAGSTLRPSLEGVGVCAIAFANLVTVLDQAIDDGRMLAFERS